MFSGAIIPSMLSREINQSFSSELLAPSRDTGGGSIHQPKKQPMPHQQEAVRDILKVLGTSGEDVRTQAHMACGTGKTMVGLWVAEKLKAKKTLLCEPSLALIAQNLREWRINARGEQPEFLVVCSDQSTVKLNSDEMRVDPSEIPARVTNDPKEIANFLRDSSKRRVVISTYHSLALVGQGMRGKGTEPFDCTVADEAHRTAGKSDGLFSLIHYPEVVRSRTRLYLTATPKIYQGDSDILTSMDDETTFGKVSHSLPFSKAIEKKLLADYRLIVATLPESYLKDLEFDTVRERRDAIAQYAVLKAIQKYKLSKILSFHSTVARAHGFVDSLEGINPQFVGNRKLLAHGVDGSMPSKQREQILKLFREQDSRGISLVSNCRCLTEGVDIPAIDGVVFFDPKTEEIDIVQAIGRAIRRSTAGNKEFGNIIVPIVVSEDIENADFLGGSEYRKIIQVMRALRAHDDRFEVRVKTCLSENDKRGGLVFPGKTWLTICVTLSGVKTGDNERSFTLHRVLQPLRKELKEKGRI